MATGLHRALVVPVQAGSLPPAVDRRFEAVMFDWDGTAVPDRSTDASADEEAALTTAAALTQARLAERGLHVEIVSARLNRRKIDLIPEPAWADPPKARIEEVLAAVEGRLPGCWEGLEVPVMFRGARIRVMVRASGLRIEADRAVSVSVSGRPPVTVGPEGLDVALSGHQEGGAQR